MNNDVFTTITACFRDDRGRLVVRDGHGQEHRDVTPVRMFPITDPEGCISICDSHYRELLCVRNIEDVPGESRRILEEELNRRMFIPVIERIAGSAPVGDDVRFSVVTDRGKTDIVVNAEEIYRLSGNRVLMKDSNGIRYLVPDWRRMNAYSRKILDLYL